MGRDPPNPDQIDAFASSFWGSEIYFRDTKTYLVTDPYYEGRRNLITVRQLIARGDWETLETLKEDGEEDLPTAHELLFEGMRRNDHFEGVIASAGDSFGSMAVNSSKTFESVIQVANRNTEFIDSPGMRRCLEASDFALSDLKTDPKGVSLYLSLPQRYMGTHYRWLRMMIALTITEMEKTRRQPASGHRVLMVLDEFAGLKRMEVIENAAAQIAGYGVKMWFVLQTLGQLKDTYKENWQTFLANCGLQLYAQVDDEFTRKHVSETLGETEISRQTESTNLSDGQSSSGVNFGSSKGWSETLHKTHLLTASEIGKAFARVDDKEAPNYPGLALAMIPGLNPVLIHKANYFEDPFFSTLFDPHPDHPEPKTIEELSAQKLATAEKKKRIDADLLQNTAPQVLELIKINQASSRRTYIGLEAIVGGFIVGFAFIGLVVNPIRGGVDQSNVMILIAIMFAMGWWAKNRTEKYYKPAEAFILERL